MRRIKKLTFKDLVEENKKELLNDQDALDLLEAKLEAKLEQNMRKAQKRVVNNW